jgi:hypothetical protein
MNNLRNFSIKAQRAVSRHYSYGSGALNDIYDGYHLLVFIDLTNDAPKTFLREFSSDLLDDENTAGFFILKHKNKYTFAVSMKKYLIRHSIGNHFTDNFDDSVDFALVDLSYLDWTNDQIEDFINKYSIEWVKPNQFRNKWMPKFENMRPDEIANLEDMMIDLYQK